MELAFVLLFVLLGTGAILYAGLRRQLAPPEPPTGNALGAASGEGEAPADGANDGRD
ncbi:hypothetical protein [Devosia sp. CAU 1758]